MLFAHFLSQPGVVLFQNSIIMKRSGALKMPRKGNILASVRNHVWYKQEGMEHPYLNSYESH